MSGAPSGNLERVRWRDRRAGRRRRRAIRNVFLFVGADPATEWLQGCVALDKAGFVTTGVAPAAAPPARRLNRPFPACSRSATCGRGRSSGSAGAIGEGAAVVAAIHNFLAHTHGPASLNREANPNAEDLHAFRTPFAT